MHNACYIVAIPSSIYLTYLNPVFGIGSFVGYAVGRYIEPDWDAASITESESNTIHELKVFGYLLYGVSSVYGAIFRKHHRSFITHFPIFSTIIRIIFVFWWISLLYIFRLIIFDWWQLWLFLGVWFGLAESDLNHWICDMIWSDDGKRFIEDEKIRKQKRRNK